MQQPIRLTKHSIIFQFLKIKTKINKSTITEYFTLIAFLLTTTIIYSSLASIHEYLVSKALHPRLANIIKSQSFLSKNILPIAQTKSPPILQNKPITKNYDKIISQGNTKRKILALTFDADMTPSMKQMLQTGEAKTFNDTNITDYLIKTNTKATIFLSGMWIEEYPDQTRSIGKNPLFELANHSYSHPSFAGDCYGLTRAAPDQLPEEIKKTQKLISKIGGSTSKYFRFPGGCFNKTALALVKQNNLEVVHWSDVAYDGFNADPKSISQKVINQAQNGGIIVMHLGGETNTPATAKALPEIITTLKKQGYKFVTVSELLHPELAHTPTLQSLLNFSYLL